jgi:hypothetical protein
VVFSCPSKYVAQTLSSQQQNQEQGVGVGKSKAGAAGAAGATVVPREGPRQSATYLYHFEHHPRQQANVTRHVSELQYSFHQNHLTRHPADRKLADVMATYWGNMIAAHDPNAAAAAVDTAVLAVWPSYQYQVDNLLAIREYDNVTVVTGLKATECDFHIARTDASIRANYPPA